MPVAKDREASNADSEVGRQRIRRVRRETLRRGLIKIFVAQQSSVRTHLCLPDIAKQWAPLRRESTLKAAKEAALDDLMEAVSDGHIRNNVLKRTCRGGIRDRLTLVSGHRISSE